MPYQLIANSSGSIRYHYELLGDESKQPLVLIAGYTSNLDAWRGLAEALKNHFYILIFDNQGIGLTEEGSTAPVPLTIDMMAENTIALIRSLSLSNPIIAGFAMGSTIAQKIAFLSGNQIKQLVLISSLIKWSDSAKAICETLCKQRETGQLEQYAETILTTCFSHAYRHALSKQAGKEFIKNLSNILRHSQTAKGQRKQVEALKASDSSQWANEINVPTLVLSPAEDQFASLEQGAALVKAIGKNSKQVIIPNSGHAVLDENLDAVVRSFKEYCRVEYSPNKEIS